MAEKPKPETPKLPKFDHLIGTSGIRNGAVKDKPTIDKTSMLPPPPAKPKK